MTSIRKLILMVMIGSIVIVLPAQASRIKQSTEIEGALGFGGNGGFGGGGMPGGMFGGGGQPGPSGGGFPDMSGMMGGGEQGPLAKMSAEDKDATRPEVDPITPECFKATVQSRTSMIPIIMPGKMYYNSPAKSLRIEDPELPAADYEIQRYDLHCKVKAQSGEKLKVEKLMEEMSGFQLPPRELTTYEGTEVVGDVKCHRYTFKLGVPDAAEIQFTSWIRVQAPHVPVYLIADTKAGPQSLSLHQYLQDHTIGCDFAPDIFDAPDCSSDGGRPPRALVFSEHAGEGAIAGEADEFGNVKGDIGDLVRDGTFKGQTVVVLKLIHESACTFNEAKAALEKKGLTVTVYDAGNLPDATDLDKELQDANQCWVISDDRDVLKATHVQALLKHWKNGMGMYVLGDNLPFFHDANVLLAEFGLPQLQGNRPGGTALKESTYAKGPGFIRHPLTTGLVSLFEGSTVSTLPETAVTDAGMVAIMREHQYKEIVLAYLEAKEGNGGLVVDGGFTKLYPQLWATTSGSARLVVNIAAMLAVK